MGGAGKRWLGGCEVAVEMACGPWCSGLGADSLVTIRACAVRGRGRRVRGRGRGEKRGRETEQDFGKLKEGSACMVLVHTAAAANTWRWEVWAIGGGRRRVAHRPWQEWGSDGPGWWRAGARQRMSLRNRTLVTLLRSLQQLAATACAQTHRPTFVLPACVACVAAGSLTRVRFSRSR